MSCEERTFDAVIENGSTILGFVGEQLEANDCSAELRAEINIAVDELFSNIAFYAYPEGKGFVAVRIQIDDAKVILAFIDAGKPYNPLAKEDPDIDLEAEERPIGGLGIYIVKQMASDVRYEYTDGHNVLTVVFAR